MRVIVRLWVYVNTSQVLCTDMELIKGVVILLNVILFRGVMQCCVVIVLFCACVSEFMIFKERRRRYLLRLSKYLFEYIWTCPDACYNIEKKLLACLLGILTAHFDKSIKNLTTRWFLEIAILSLPWWWSTFCWSISWVPYLFALLLAATEIFNENLKISVAALW